MSRLSRAGALALLSLLLFALGNDRCNVAGVPGDRPTAIVDPTRPHLLDAPYPSDDLRAAGGVDLVGFPITGPAIGQDFMTAWVDQVRLALRAFPTVGPIVFRFDGPLPPLEDRYESAQWDPIRLYSLDSPHRVPVEARFVESAGGDPYLRDHTLFLRPDERHPLRNGERYAAVVAGGLALPAPGWTPPPELAGQNVAVATVFTVQDHFGDLAALRDAADAFLDADPTLLAPPGGLREVASLAYAQGTTTPAGNPATVETVTFADGGSETTFLDDRAGLASSFVDLTTGPMAVYQATIQTAAFQDPTGRPYQSPGFGIIFDPGRTDGWIAFDATGALLSAPRSEPVRVVVQVPRTGTDHAVVLWGHGSGGDAYEAVARKDPANDLLSIREVLADAGAIVVSADLPLFGRRFDLIDRGYASNLAVVNIPNLPAFRDNLRQGAVDRHVLFRFATEVLPGLLASGLVDAARVGAFGHSIGAQIGDMALGLHQTDGPSSMLGNGAPAFQTQAVLEADLLSLGGDVAAVIFALAGIAPPPDATPAEILGALFGVPESAWGGIDRYHPLAIPFQAVVDGGDPLGVAAEHPILLKVFQGENESRVPPESAAWLADATENGSLTSCVPSGPYDGHVCVFREPAGLDAFEDLVESLGP